MAAVMQSDGGSRMRWSRYPKVLDVGILLVALIIFLLFMVLLIQIVFPHGSRLGEGMADRNSTVLVGDAGGDVDVVGGSATGLAGFVASLGDVRRDVKLRSRDSIAWSSASEGDVVRNRDSVQTFANSRARVDFTTDNELRMDQNSLVVFRSGAADPFLQRRAPAVTVLDGALSGTINADYGAFGVQIPAGLVELTAEEHSDTAVDFRVGINPDESSTIAIYSGQADVNIAGEHYQVSANHGLTITADGTTVGARALPSPPSMRAPDDNAITKYLAVPPRIGFRWGRVANAQNYRLELASDANFSQILVDQYFDGTSFTHGNLAPGEYFWRISARSGWAQGPTSLPRSLRIVRDSEPPLLELQTIEHVGGSSYVLRGKTAKDARVFILGQSVESDSGGNFEFLFNPEPGTHSIVVESIDAIGNVAYGSQILHVPGTPGRSD
jgi:hypothetical protein